MNLEQVRRLFAYDSWANDRVFSAAAELTDEERHRDLQNSHGSLFGTLVHIVGAEEVWLSRWKGDPLSRLLSEQEVPNLDALSRRWDQVREERDRFVSGLTDKKLDESLEVTTSTGQRYENRYWEMIQHLANHSSHHRGQAVTLLRQLGARPPATDLILFYRQNPSS